MSLPLKRENVFAFFADALNLERITPPELGFSIITTEPINIKEGTKIEYRLSLFGIPFKWKTKISLWDPPSQFIDEQIDGPYKIWIHTHQFKESNHSTTIKDKVQYQLPFHPIGEIAYPLVYLQLKRIFSYRQKMIRKILLR
jgi:ligand-binding SRPBCC domain-containing protein